MCAVEHGTCHIKNQKQISLRKLQLQRKLSIYVWVCTYLCVWISLQPSCYLMHCVTLVNLYTHTHTLSINTHRGSNLTPHTHPTHTYMEWICSTTEPGTK
jgi:hypothetical protein